MSNSKLKL